MFCRQEFFIRIILITLSCFLSMYSLSYGWLKYQVFGLTFDIIMFFIPFLFPIWIEKVCRNILECLLAGPKNQFVPFSHSFFLFSFICNHSSTKIHTLADYQVCRLCCSNPYHLSKIASTYVRICILFRTNHSFLYYAIADGV